jgi:hypothetical protein
MDFSEGGAVKIALTWDEPFRLRDGAKFSQVYYCPKLDRISNKAGVYVFARSFGAVVAPLYVGQALRLRSRIRHHFKGNVRLMIKLKEADIGHRIVLVGRLKLGRGQQKKKVLDIVESSLIKHIIAQGHTLFNKQNVKIRVHTIKSKGNRSSKQIAPPALLVERK